MKLCDRCRVSGCCLNYLGTACANARAQECSDVQANNAELIHNMTLDELAAFLAAWAQESKVWNSNVCLSIRRGLCNLHRYYTDHPQGK